MCWKSKFLESSGPGLLPGITAGQWLRLLREIDFDIDYPYFSRAMFISGCSVLNSIGKRIESLIFSRRIAKQVVKAPVFILGSWRSGTTLLQNLLSNDSRFGFPNLYQTLFPRHFLYTEPMLGGVIGRLIPASRPQDNVKLSSEQPSEEEIAISTLDCMSHLVGDTMVPRNRDQFAKFINLKSLSLEEKERWKESFQYFARKLAIRHQKPLMLKSPPNTARIRVLLELFPDAKFIMIHRHPYDVVRSGMSWLKKVRTHWALQKSDHEDVKDIFITNYRDLMNDYLEQRQLIDEKCLVEVAFSELEKRPMQTLENVYSHLDLPEFAETRDDLQSYVDANSGYQKNRFAPLADAIQSEVFEKCRNAFDAWGYGALADQDQKKQAA